MVIKFEKIFIYIIFLTFISLILSTFVYGDISKGSPSIIVYDAGRNQLITGYINLSIENETGGSDVEISIDNKLIKKMKLIDLIKAAIEKGKSFNCYYDNQKASCDKIFEVVSSKEIYNGNRGEHYVGFDLTKPDTIESLSFVINGSSSGEECGKSPLSLDLFVDNVVDYLYVNPGLNTCGYKFSKNYKETATSYDVLIDGNWKCENITFGYISGKVIIGGIIKLENTSYTTNEDDLIFKIKTPTQDYFCNTTTTSISYEKVYCEVDVFVKPETYEICVKATSNAANSEAFTLLKKNAYALFGSEFANMQLYGSIDFNSSIYEQQTGRNLKNDLNNFINNINCSEKCIIPIYINSTQPFGLRDLSLKYKSGDDIITLSQFSKLSIEYPEIDSQGYQAIPLEVFNITAPFEYGSHKLSIEIAGKEFSSNFYVQEVPIVAGIIPTEAIVGEDTQFTIIAFSPKGNTIVSYSVDWGDGTSSQGSSNTFKHKYNNEGSYTVFITVKDNESLVGSGNFVVYVGITLTSLNQSINDALQKINTIQLDPLISEFLNLNQTKQKLNQLLTDLSIPNANLVTIKNEFDSLKQNIPIAVQSTQYPSLTYRVNWQNIDVDKVEDVIDESCPSSDDACKKGIALWNRDLLSIGGEKIRISFYDANQRTFTKVNVYPKRSETGNIIIHIPSSSIKSYSQFEDLQDAISIDIKSFSFVYDGDLDIYNLNLYAVPSSFSHISIEEEPGEGELYKPPKNFFWIIFLLLFLLLIIALVIVWLPYIKNMLKAKEKERIRKLFPSLTDYYNLTNFITNALTSGETEDKIYGKLLKAGWKKEQISYIMKEVKKKIPKKKK